MRYETGTFELRDNDMMMRELSSAETDEVVGGSGTANVSAALTSFGAGSSAVSIFPSFFSLVTSNTSASAFIVFTASAVGVNQMATSAFAEVV